MEPTQVLELTQTLEASQTTESSDVAVKVGCLNIHGEDYFIWNKENTIGRDESCDVVINSKAVSVEHAIIEADAFGKHLIWDLGSTNKTRLGEVQLKPRVRHYLNDGARLRFANVNAVYHHLKVISPQKPLLPEPVAKLIPGTPERAEEDAAAVASIVAESPSKDDENDASSDGDFFGEKDSSALFMRPLVEDHSAGTQSSNCPNTKTSLNYPEVSATSKDTELQPKLNPVDQLINESSVCEADTSDVTAGEADTFDVIAGSQPMPVFTPEKALTIYEVDTVPTDRVEETPVKALKNDELNWEDIDDTIHEISQEMDTIDTLIENKELCVKFTPPKRIADSTSVEKNNPLAAVNPKPPSKSTPASRNLDRCFEEPPSLIKPQVSGSECLAIPSCVKPLHDDKMNIYDVETEPLHVVGAKRETNENIFDLETQDVHGSKEENVRPEAETSVYDLATQEFFATESKKPVGDTVNPSLIPENISLCAADVSISDLPTQAAGQLLPLLASDDKKGSSIPKVGVLAPKEAVSESPVLKAQIRNGENPVDSLHDMLTQAGPADMISIHARALEPPVKTNEPEPLNVSFSDMATQPVSKGSELPPQGVSKNEPTGHSFNGANKTTEVKRSDIQLNGEPKSNNLRGLGDISISEMATQQKGNGFTSPLPSHDISLSDMMTPRTEKNMCVAETDLADVQMHASQCIDVNLGELQTQITGDRISNHPTGSCADVSLSDLETQVADMPHKNMPEESNTADISISDLQTQVSTVPASTAGVHIPKNQTQLVPIPPTKEGVGAAGPNSEDIYNVLTQIPVADHQIMCEESNTEQIEIELDGYENGMIDSTLGKSSDGSSGSLADSVSPFKTPALQAKASKISPSNPNNDDVYLLDTQPLHVPFPSHDASGDACTDDFKPSSTKASKNIIADTASQKLASEPAQSSVYDAETDDVGKTEETSKPAGIPVYDFETQDVCNAEEASKPEAISVYDVETQDFDKAEEVCIFDVDTVPFVGAELANKAHESETSVDKESKAPCVQEKSAALIDSRMSKHRYSHDLDTNSVENRIRAMNDRNVNSPVVKKEPLNNKSTVAELLETLEGTPSLPGGKVLNPIGGADLSQNSETVCSHFPVGKPHKKVKALVYTDSEDSHDGPLVVHGNEEKPTAGKVGTVDSTHGDSDLSQTSNARCSQFPVENVHKKVKPLAFSDSEDSWDSPLLAQKKNKKPLEVSADEKCAIYPAKEDEKTVFAASPGLLCNGDLKFPKENSKGNLVANGSRLSNAESRKISEDAVLGGHNDVKSEKFKTSVNNDTGESESLQLHLSDISMNCSVTERTSMPLGTKDSEEVGTSKVKDSEEVGTSKVESSSRHLEGSALRVSETIAEYGKLREDPVPEKLVIGATSKVSGDVSCHKVSTPSERKRKDTAIPEESNSVENTKRSESDMPVTAIQSCESGSSKKESLGPLPEESEPDVNTSTQAQSEHTLPKSMKQERENTSISQPNLIDEASPQVGTTSENPRRTEKAIPETPEIPQDFFGTPLVHDRPPLRQYVNRKKLSLNASSPLKRPNASSTPLSDKDSHSVIDMEETLLTTIPKTDDKTVKKAAESVDHHDASQGDTPKNVKRFKKSPVKKPSQDHQLFSQHSETLSSQDELADSQELGRGKRRRVKKNFFGFDDTDDTTSTKVASPKPCSSAAEVKISTSSKVREDSTAQPSLDVSPIISESQEATAPRRERPRKQAFMSCESNEAGSAMEKYTNDDCYVKSQKHVDASCIVLETVAVLRQASAEPETKSPGKMDLTRMKNSLKASLTRGFSVHKADEGNAKFKTSGKLGAEAPHSPGESLTLEKRAPMPKSGFRSGEMVSLQQPVQSKESPIVTSPVQRGRSRVPRNKCTTPTPSSEIPANHADVDGALERARHDVDISKSSVRPGRGSQCEVDTCTDPSGGANSQDEDVEVNALPESPTQPGQGHPQSKGKLDPISGKPSTSSNKEVSPSEKEISNKVQGDIQAITRDLDTVPRSSVLPSRGRRRKENATPEPSSKNNQELPARSAAKPSENNCIIMREGRRKRQRNEDLAGSQDSQLELSQESQSSVCSNFRSARGARKTPLSSQVKIIPDNVGEPSLRKRRRRKLSAGSENSENREAVDYEYNQKKPSSRDKGGVTHETPHEQKSVVAEKSVAPLERGRGRPQKLTDTATTVPEPGVEPSLSTSTTGPPNVSNSRPNKRGLQRQQDELSQDSQPEASRSSSKRGTGKRHNVATTIPTENDDQWSNSSKKPKVTSGDENAQTDYGTGTALIAEGASKRSASRRGARQIVSKDRLNGSPSDPQSSSVVSVSRRRGNRNATETVPLPDVPAPEGFSASDASICKTRGNPKKVLKNAVGFSVHAREELSATEVSGSKTRGRRKKVVEHSIENEDRLQLATMEVTATEVPSASKTRGRPKKVVEDAAVKEDRLLPVPEKEKATEVPSASKARGRRPKKAVEEVAEEEGSSQDLSQGRRSGRARKKKESFDELMSRKEEEIRLKKLQQNAAQSPSPDKSQRLSLVTPSASVASISDESAFSIPASPASSNTGKRSACRFGTLSTESLPSSTKKRNKEDLPPTPLAGQVKVMFTALADKKLAAMVKKLGGKVVEKPADCTVLVTDKVIRTVKFLCALALGKPIVSPNWISKSKAFSQFTEPNESLLKDTDGETKFEFELSSSLVKAKSQKLLEGYSVYTTASILPPPKEMKPIIECSGGTFLAKPPAKWGPHAIVISDLKDKSEWPKLTKNGVTPPILSAEAILSGILQQQFEIEKHRLK